jgi:hypothetical protein
MTRNRFPVLVAAALLALAAPRLAAQSLGDVAKKEEDRRKHLKEPAKVLTNKDLNAPPPTSAPPPAAAPAANAATDAAKNAGKDSKDAKDAKDAKDKEPAKDEAYWRGRLKSLQQAMDRNQTYAEALQTRINALNADFVNRDDPAQRAVIANDRQRATTELNRLKDQIQQDKKALADLQEEARRAGVPPGWLR